MIFSDHKFNVIAGPCLAESPSLLNETASFLKDLQKELGFQLIFKSSFDKANRTSISSQRGAGLSKALGWMEDVKETFKIPLTTDIHECGQVPEVSEVIDLLQIPAFLCRQTDLIVAAAKSGRAVSVKKGQFLNPAATKHIASKLRESGLAAEDCAIIERGSSFGYDNLVVDYRGLKKMSEFFTHVFFDCTHSTQQPSEGATTEGLRHCAPLLARAASASGYITGIFLEVHPVPSKALSDAATQLNFEQSAALIQQCMVLHSAAQELQKTDNIFI